MKAFLILPPARADLRDIWACIRDRSNGSQRADAMIDSIMDAIRRLADFPYAGRVHEDVLDETYRFWPVYSYEIIYRPDTDPLEIARILSGYRDLPRIL